MKKKAGCSLFYLHFILLIFLFFPSIYLNFDEKLIIIFGCFLLLLFSVFFFGVEVSYLSFEFDWISFSLHVMFCFALYDIGFFVNCVHGN